MIFNEIIWCNIINYLSSDDHKIISRVSKYMLRIIRQCDTIIHSSYSAMIQFRIMWQYCKIMWIPKYMYRCNPHNESYSISTQSTQSTQSIQSIQSIRFRNHSTIISCLKMRIHNICTDIIMTTFGNTHLSVKLQKHNDIIFIENILPPNMHIVELNLNDCCNLTDVSKLGNITKLDLSGCINVTDVSALGAIQWISLHNCIGITDVSALHSVRGLILNGCTGITDVSMLTNVQALDLRNVVNVTDISALLTTINVVNICGSGVDFNSMHASHTCDKFYFWHRNNDDTDFININTLKECHIHIRFGCRYYIVDM